MNALLTLLVLAASPFTPAQRWAEAPLPRFAAAPAVPEGHAPAGTRCEACHTPDGWKQVTFPHDRTGFPLEGAHAGVTCRSCHTGRFEEPLPRTCAGCHRDPHRGELGQRCEGCHDARSWMSSFSADAHRRTAFPLTGRHAVIPCVQCHPNVRDRAFTGAAVGCITCHADDYARTRQTSIDHVASGFSTACETCHDPAAWGRARMAQHDQCFQITGGDHAGIRCRDCHTTLVNVSFTGACATMTASCTSCHEHSCGEMNEEHDDVPGYQCRDRKCYECHRFTPSGG